ncbi:Signal transduction histidine kinase [Microlunatus sagamiharensis]|uniref:histidine kinase n=1 Tax=Microlunatus sagamiharensis TaxID=546874 RepID=A0A1H2LQX8_9ACTN|nr:HAMP domain-containing sensor histidine kinase [Microlunatus sagamiharensis]SDU83254.1 Signal transduction histidine kinase [Microlunatus sagamiharensis]
MTRETQRPGLRPDLALRRPWSFDRWGSRLGVRARSVLVAVVVVVVALLLGGTGLVYALQSSLEQAVEATGRARAAEIVSRITTNGLDETVAALGDQARTDAVTLVLDASGAVVGSSRRATTTALSDQRPAVGAYTSVERDIDTLNEGGEWKVVTTALTADRQTYYVQVAVPITLQRTTVQTVAVLLLAGTPLLLLLVAGAVWVLVGRALRSVESIRTTVAEIDARALTARLDVPQTQDEIAALATTMNAMLDRLQASDRAQRAFVSDASHELRSPLATLSTAAELAGRTHDEEVRTRLLGTMNAELDRMRELVGNLMSLARAESPDAVGAVVEVDLDDLVDHEVRRLRTTSALRVEGHVEPVRVRADLSRVAQPLRNLVDNAERHADTQVALTVTTRGDEAVIWVDNDGPEVDPADRERVFERFVRLDVSRSRDVGGSGLGLAIARAAVASQGGRVQVVDHPRAWCRFEIVLPLDPADASTGAVDDPRPLPSEDSP